MTDWSRHQFWLLVHDEKQYLSSYFGTSKERAHHDLWILQMSLVPQQKITNQVYPARTSGSIRHEVGLIFSPFVADAALPGVKTRGQKLWPFGPRADPFLWQPGPLLFVQSFCCCDLLLLVLDFANMDVSSLGKLQWCLNNFLQYVGCSCRYIH